MKILVFSDTHGRINRAEEIFNILSAEEKITMIFHCGDYQRDADSLAQDLKVPVISVPGNCDGSIKRDFQIATLPSGKVMIIHGHTEGVDWDYGRISLLAEEHGCNAVCFGHTHVPVNDGNGRVYLVNPGSLTNPRGGSRRSCALLTSEPGTFNAEILYYDDIVGKPHDRSGSASGGSRGKRRGGFLKKIMNYSDGQ
jgi:putative phosphoesterase